MLGRSTYSLLYPHLLHALNEGICGDFNIPALERGAEVANGTAELELVGLVWIASGYHPGAPDSTMLSEFNDAGILYS